MRFVILKASDDNYERRVNINSLEEIKELVPDHKRFILQFYNNLPNELIIYDDFVE